MKAITYFLLALMLAACGSTPTQKTRWVHDLKPISEFDTDMLKCIQVARGVTGNPMQMPNDRTCSKGIYGRTVTCTDDNYLGNALLAAMNEGDVSSFTNECMQRQGWRTEVVSTPSSQGGVTFYSNKLGQSCNNSNQCEGRLICANGSCASANTMSCNHKSDCPSGLTCNNSVCTISGDGNRLYSMYDLGKKKGEVCSNSSECIIHLKCHFSVCIPDYLASNSPNAPVKLSKTNEQCASDWNCLDGLSCRNNICKDKSSIIGFSLKEGESCTRNTECGRGLDCKNNKCAPF